MEPLVWGVAIAGVALAALRCGRMFFGTINQKMFNQVTLKLIRAGDMERALKLCNAVPSRSTYGQVVKKLITYSAELGPSDGRSLVGAALRETLERECERTRKQARAGDWIWWLAIACAGGAPALGMAYEVEAMAPTLYMPGAAMVLTLWGWYRVRQIATGCEEHGAEIAEALADSVMSEEKSE